MGYTKFLRKACKKDNILMPVGSRQTLDDAIVACDQNPKCNSIYLPNCKEKSKEDMLLCQGEPEYSNNRKSCLWAKRKFIIPNNFSYGSYTIVQHKSK